MGCSRLCRMSSRRRNRFVRHAMLLILLSLPTAFITLCVCCFPDVSLTPPDDQHAEVEKESQVRGESSTQATVRAENTVDWSVISPSLRKASLNFLSEYKNPCWKEPLPKGNPYTDNIYLMNKRTAKPFKTLAEHWRQQRLTGQAYRLRCLPYFYIVSMAKCATTDLFFKMAYHPDVAPSIVKEPHWWTTRRIGLNQPSKRRDPVPFDDYVSLFDEAAVAIMKNGNNHTITGEASITTLWYNDRWRSQPDNPPNLTEPQYLNVHYLHAIQPGAKIITILRQPSERLYSDYLYFPGTGKSAQAFHHHCQHAITVMTSCIRDRGLRACVYGRQVNSQIKVNLRTSIYYPFIRDWLDVYPRDQFLFLRFEDYVADRIPVLGEVFRFLELAEISSEVIDRICHSRVENSRRADRIEKGDILPETRQLLDRFYSPYNKLLSELLIDERFLWR